MSTDFKYDEAAYSIDRRIYTLIKIEELIDFYSANPLHFQKRYYGNLFCPECHKPQLSLAYISKTNNYYLKGFPKQLHSEHCSKNFKYADTEILNTIISTNNSYELINSKLKKIILNKFFKNEEKYTLLIKTDNLNNIPNEITEEDITNRRNIQQIPSKSLTAPFYNEDFGKYKLFYGNVDISVVERTNKNNNETFYTLDILKKNTKYRICSLSMNENVGKHFMKLYNIKPDKVINNIYISFWTKMVLKGHYKNGTISHSQLCFITTE